MKLKLGTKISLLCVGAIALLCGVITHLLVQSKDHLIREKEKLTKHLVECAVNTVETYQNNVSTGKMSKEDAQLAAADAISKLRFQEGNYLFIHDFDCKMVMHPAKPSMNGKNFADTQDPNGIYIFRELAALGKKEGQGYLQYTWMKPQTGKNTAKLTYIQSIPDWQWVIGTGVYMDDVQADVMAVTKSALLLTGLILAICLVSVYILSRRLVKPLRDAGAVIEVLEAEINAGQADLRRELPVSSHDEIGLFTQKVNRLLGHFRNIIQEIKNSTNHLTNSANALAATSLQMNSDSELVSQETTQVSATTTEVSTNIQMMATAAEQIATNINSVSAASEEMSGNMSNVTETMTFLHNTIADVEASSRHSREISVQCRTKAQAAGDTMGKLQAAAADIDKITEMIRKIAEQTNLLALNATIEAASAGAAGKGFAVVANEIKDLATQSAQAVNDINTRLKTMQNHSQEAANGLQEMNTIISTIEETAEKIDEALNEQMKMATSVKSNVTEASTGMTEISRSISEVAIGAREVSGNTGEAAISAESMAKSLGNVQVSISSSQQAVTQVSQAAEELSRLAETLDSKVAGFQV